MTTTSAHPTARPPVARAAIPAKTLRTDRWWLPPLTIGAIVASDCRRRRPAGGALDDPGERDGTNRSESEHETGEDRNDDEEVSGGPKAKPVEYGRHGHEDSSASRTGDYRGVPRSIWAGK